MKTVTKGNLESFLDMDLADLPEGTPLSESGGVIEFTAETEAMREAMAKANIRPDKIKHPKARSLFLMRCFYLLGVFRGGAAARTMLLEDDGAASEPPELSGPCSRLFAAELEDLNAFALTALCWKLGL